MPKTATCSDIEMTAVEDENVCKSDCPVVEPVSEKIVSDNTLPRPGNKMESSQEASISKDSESAYLSNKMPMTSHLNKENGFAHKLDHDDDDIPDIVDADPDSDSS
ncbi:hypothetical protein K1719_017772 [Acacia pycnantha]|nr:hypothetical protein K1719_017772 [Acacia pycnantha]